MKHEPTYVEIFLTRLAFFFCGGSVYRAFADRLPLGGHERVLDFGCGMGTVAYFVAKRLHRGHLTCLDVSERWLNACRKTLRSFWNVSFLRGEATHLTKESFDIVYCHFVLRDIPERELERIIPALSVSLKRGGLLVFREPLKETGKLGAIKRLMEGNGMSPSFSRVTDVPIMGNALESVYIKL
jgi:ubiquinone/menaquinone biosynthesis C-methylase UbiE